MGKKSKFYDAYRQGKCVLEEALKPLPDEQREIIAQPAAQPRAQPLQHNH